jgi:hypothetical protein
MGLQKRSDREQAEHASRQPASVIARRRDPGKRPDVDEPGACGIRHGWLPRPIRRICVRHPQRGSALDAASCRRRRARPAGAVGGRRPRTGDRRIRGYSAVTGISRGRACAVRGTFTVSTPSANAAAMSSSLMPDGSCRMRSKRPIERSWRR